MKNVARFSKLRTALAARLWGGGMLVVWAALLAGAAGSHAADEMSLERGAESIRVLHGGKPFAEYLFKSGAKPIVWPIIGPSGVEMTRAFPMKTVPGEDQDHKHQRSFWFTHGDVNGVDFWSEEEGHGDIVQRELKQAEAQADRVTIRTVNDWIGPDGKKHCEDERTIVFRVLGDRRFIDFEAVVTASEGDLTFGETKEGSFGVRMPSIVNSKPPGKGRIVNAEGLTNDNTWGKASPWVDYHGPIGDKMAGVAILDHPSSFRFPTTWHVRNYGLFAANPFGLGDFTGKKDGAGAHTIPKGQTMTLRYRTIFHLGDERQADIAGAFKEWAEQNNPFPKK